MDKIFLILSIWSCGTGSSVFWERAGKSKISWEISFIVSLCLSSQILHSGNMILLFAQHNVRIMSFLSLPLIYAPTIKDQFENGGNILCKFFVFFILVPAKTACSNERNSAISNKAPVWILALVALCRIATVSLL